MAVLSMDGVTVRYGAVQALSSVSMSVDEGEFVCVAGSNGSGKSTLLKAALGLAPVSEGRVTVGRGVGYVPQAATLMEGERLFPATVREVVMTGTQRPWHFLTSRVDRNAAEDALNAFGLTELADRRIGELSGGQAQRVFLARAMCVPRVLLMLDEPCAGLDPAMRMMLYDMLRRLSRSGTAVVMVTHELGELTRDGGGNDGTLRVAVMEHGRLNV